MASLFAAADELILITAIPKLPANVGLHPGGALPDGAEIAVTACGTGKGDACTAVTSAKKASVYSMILADSKS